MAGIPFSKESGIDEDCFLSPATRRACPLARTQPSACLFEASPAIKESV